MRIPMLAVLAATPAYAATYTLEPLAVLGTKNVAVAAVNDFGVITGTAILPTAPDGVGFVGKPRSITRLPKPGRGTLPGEYIPTPTAINSAGAVIGTYMAGQRYVFVWQGSRYTAIFGQSEPEPAAFLPAPFITSHDALSYDQYVGDGVSIAYAGNPQTQSALPRNGAPAIVSTNSQAQVAGEYETFVGQNVTAAVFTGTTAQLQPLLPPKAQASHGGWINEAGQVAGSYQTAKALRGFLYTAGAYRTFALRTSPTSLTVQGIDKHGRIVGAYTDANGQYGFVHAHGKTTRFGAFNTADTVHVGISQSGTQLVVSDTAPSPQTSRSFLVTCTGDAC